MVRLMTFALSLALAACSPPARTGVEAGPASASAQTPAGADETIAAWYRARHGSNLIEPVETFYGDFSGDGAADALAFGYFDMGGSGAGLTIALFRNQNGTMTLVRTIDDVFGMEPRNVAIAPGRITLTTTMPQPGDPHCCPTGSQDWTIETN